MGPGGIYGLILEYFTDWYLNHVEANRPILQCLFCLVIVKGAKVRSRILEYLVEILVYFDSCREI